MALPGGAITLVSVVTVFSVLAVCAVILRFYAIRILVALDGGAGLQMTDASPQEIETLLKIFFAAPIIWAFATGFVKLSILSFYHKVFGSRKEMRIAIYTVTAVVGILFLVTVLEPLLMCRPIKYTWDKVNTKGTCGNTQKAFLGVAAVNLVVDLVIFALPLPLLWQLKMSTGKKLGISGILALGLMYDIFISYFIPIIQAYISQNSVCIVSGLRIESLLSLKEENFTFTVIRDATYGALEVQLGTTNACLPFYRPLLLRYFPKLQTRSTTGKTWENSDRTRDTMERSRRLKLLASDTYGIDTLTSQTYAARDSRGDSRSIDMATPPEQITVNQSIDIYYEPK
ncbi:hypothetical protein FQN57_001101 [Myotisia sp. PD_48]|nr:hypothetical protein FQN57_001101 [Myotisia sp. PD_48]